MATLSCFLFNTFRHFRLHHGVSGLDCILRKSHIWQICWWCQQWSQPWWTTPNLEVAYFLLISCLKSLCVLQAGTYQPKTSLPVRMTAVMQLLLESVPYTKRQGKALQAGDYRSAFRWSLQRNDKTTKSESLKIKKKKRSKAISFGWA